VVSIAYCASPSHELVKRCVNQLAQITGKI